MINDNNNNPVIFADKSIGDCTLNSDIFGPLPLRITEIDSSKEYKHIVKNIERLVRASYEYKIWRKYVLDTLGHNYCAFTGEVSEEVTIELHHHPITLYNLVAICIENRMSKNSSFCTLDIATEVLELHYNNLVGYVPLCKTIHEKYHNGYLKIAIEKCYGNWQELFKIYEIPQEILNSISSLMMIHESSEIKNWPQASVDHSEQLNG